jgi:hypothetical protein
LQATKRQHDPDSSDSCYTTINPSPAASSSLGKEQPAMTPNFHIFKSEPKGEVRWIGSQNDIEAAKRLIETRGQSEPGEYVIWSIKTGNKFSMTVTYEE